MLQRKKLNYRNPGVFFVIYRRTYVLNRDERMWYTLIMFQKKRRHVIVSYIIDIIKYGFFEYVNSK